MWQQVLHSGKVLNYVRPYGQNMQATGSAVELAGSHAAFNEITHNIDVVVQRHRDLLSGLFLESINLQGNVTNTSQIVAYQARELSSSRIAISPRTTDRLISWVAQALTSGQSENDVFLPADCRVMVT